MDGTKSTRRKHTQRDYGMGFKLAVVRQVEKGDLTYKQAQKEYGYGDAVGRMASYVEEVLLDGAYEVIEEQRR